MKEYKFTITIKLKKELPEDFGIEYEEIDEWHLGKFKPNKESSNKGVKINLNSWKEVEIIYEDPKMIAGRFAMEADEAPMIFDFMIAEYIFETKKIEFGG